MINFKHKELIPLNLSFEDKLSVDSHYGSWTQGTLYEEFCSKLSDDEGEIFSDYFGNIFHSTEENVNRFRGKIQWNALIAMYIIFQINKIYWELIESKNLDEIFQGKFHFHEISISISTLLNLKKYKNKKSFIFSQWLLYPTTFTFFEKIKNSDMANLASDFIFDFMNRVHESENGEFNQSDLLRETEPKIAFPNKESINNYLNLWKKAFEDCIKYFDDNDPTLIQFYEDSYILDLNNKFFQSPLKILDEDIFYVAENLQWNDLTNSNYSQSEIDKLLSKHFFRKGNEKFE